MTDSYHFASVPQFRVGGVYRQQDGMLRAITKKPEASEGPFIADSLARWLLVGAVGAEVGFVNESTGEVAGNDGWRCLRSGRYISGFNDYDGNANLIPGELHQVNGAWVPVEQKLSFPSGSVLTTSGDKIVGREEPEAEPKREPLAHFNQRTPFDPFAGWEPPLCSFEDYACPEQNSPLQRLNDGDPANASASLLLKTA